MARKKRTDAWNEADDTETKNSEEKDSEDGDLTADLLEEEDEGNDEEEF